jgi:hypothetical protein
MSIGKIVGAGAAAYGDFRQQGMKNNLAERSMQMNERSFYNDELDRQKSSAQQEANATGITLLMEAMKSGDPQAMELAMSKMPKNMSPELLERIYKHQTPSGSAMLNAATTQNRLTGNQMPRPPSASDQGYGRVHGFNYAAPTEVGQPWTTAPFQGKEREQWLKNLEDKNRFQNFEPVDVIKMQNDVLKLYHDLFFYQEPVTKKWKPNDPKNTPTWPDFFDDVMSRADSSGNNRGAIGADNDQFRHEEEENFKVWEYLAKPPPEEEGQGPTTQPPMAPGNEYPGTGEERPQLPPAQVQPQPDPAPVDTLQGTGSQGQPSGGGQGQITGPPPSLSEGQAQKPTVDPNMIALSSPSAVARQVQRQMKLYPGSSAEEIMSAIGLSDTAKDAVRPFLGQQINGAP